MIPLAHGLRFLFLISMVISICEESMSIILSHIMNIYEFGSKVFQSITFVFFNKVGITNACAFKEKTFNDLSLPETN